MKKAVNLKKSVSQSESSKSNNNQNNFKNYSTTKFYVKDIYNKILPRINSKKNKYDRKLTEQNLTPSLASTFYTNNGKNNKLLTEINDKNINNKIIKYIVLKEKAKLKNKKKLEINPTYFDSKPRKNNNDIDLFIKEDYDNMNINKDYDYSNIIKKLDRWDEDNCFVKHNDKITLYNILNKFYKKKSMSEELKNLNTMESLLKSKTNYDNIIKQRLDYKSSKRKTKIYNIKNDDELIQNLQKNERNNKNIPYFNSEIETDDIKLTSERIKYENQLHNDLIFVNGILYNKRILKSQKSKELEELYKNREELKQAYNKNYNYNMKDYWNRYEQYDQRYKKLENLIALQNKIEKEKEKNNKSIDKEENENKTKEENNIIKEEEKEEKKENNSLEIIEEKEKLDKSFNNKNINTNLEQKKQEPIFVSPVKRTRKKIVPNTENVDLRRTHNRKYSTSQLKFIKEMNFIKATKINSINFEMKTKMEKLRVEYQERIKQIDENQIKLEEEIKIIKNEISYYKQVNEELMREYRNYYLKILKKGNDHRKEGLVWVVKNLLELQINLEYQHFPKFLTHEHIDYLIELAHLLLEQSELIIIIKVLRKKQTTTYLDENLQAYNMLDKYMENHIKEKSKRKSHMGEMFSNNLYGKNMASIVEEIDKKFDKVYKNNKEIVKTYLEKNEEEVKLRNALEHIKKGLYNGDKFIKENQTSILDAFIGNSKNKDFFSFILNIRNRLNQIEEIITNLIKKEKDYYIEQIQKYNSSTKNFDINFYKDVIKKSLFGEKFDFYE